MGRFTEAATAQREQRVSAGRSGKWGAPEASWTAVWAGKGKQLDALCKVTSAVPGKSRCYKRAEEYFGF